MIIIIMCSVILILVEGCNATQVGLSQRFIVLKINVYSDEDICYTGEYVYC